MSGASPQLRDMLVPHHARQPGWSPETPMAVLPPFGSLGSGTAAVSVQGGSSMPSGVPAEEADAEVKEDGAVQGGWQGNAGAREARGGQAAAAGAGADAGAAVGDGGSLAAIKSAAVPTKQAAAAASKIAETGTLPSARQPLPSMQKREK